MDVEVFNPVLCLLRIPPATSFKVGSYRQVLAPETGTGQSEKGAKWGLSFCHRCGINVSLQVLKSLQAQLHCLTVPWNLNKGKNPNKNLCCPAGL